MDTNVVSLTLLAGEAIEIDVARLRDNSVECDGRTEPRGVGVRVVGLGFEGIAEFGQAIPRAS